MSGVYRNETWHGSSLVRVETFDFDAGTVTVHEHGVQVSSRPTTPEDEARFAPLPPSWEEQVTERLAVAERPEHVLPWVAPTGAHDAPGIGDHRWHNSRVWRSTIVGNTVEPGTHPGFDWWVETETPAIPDKLRNPLRALRPTVNNANNVTQLKTALLSILDTLTGDA
jgi:hypothetical protein